MKLKTLTLSLMLFSSSVSAQGLSQFGMWNEYVPGPNEYVVPDWDHYEVIPEPDFRKFEGNGRPEIYPFGPEVVAFPNNEEVGTIIILNDQRKLYLILNSDAAFEYPISIGREGFAWTGVEKVSRIQDWPDWTPPKEMLKRRPDLPTFMPGGIKNPLGAKAIYLGNTLYRIHGTNDPKSIGRAESSGCIRMLNEHVVHLAQFVEVNHTIVKVY